MCLCVLAVVGKGDEVLYSKALGHLTYSADDPSTTLDTRFDIASLTKVFSTTSAVALLYERGYLSVEDRVAQYLGDDFKANGKDGISIENCLLHNAGFSPDPDPCYWYPEFACPNTDDGAQLLSVICIYISALLVFLAFLMFLSCLEFPAEDFSCLPQVWSSLMQESLNSPPGSAEVYSDLSFITLQMVVGSVTLQHQLVDPASYLPQCQEHITRADSSKNSFDPVHVVCAFEAFVRQEVFGRQERGEVWLPSTSYLPPPTEYSECAPTMNDTGTLICRAERRSATVGCFADMTRSACVVHMWCCRRGVLHSPAPARSGGGW